MLASSPDNQGVQARISPQQHRNSERGVVPNAWCSPYWRVRADMPQIVKAVYEQGSFIPETPCDLPEGAKVVLMVQHGEREGMALPPEVTAPEERAAVLQSVVERMKRNPLPPDSRRFSRDEMHDRG
ncbi:conserved hypothetical protein [Candidatus Sulfopaludibacter sp. SbA4]|nr:conserved hypothetical protein [Candidatus Sulfopaludibacter sp. SbA4]